MRNPTHDSDRSRIEDALKHLWVFEQDGLVATAESVGGALECSRKAAREVLARLQEAGLGRDQRGRFVLTDSGRDYAVQVLRAHRLYETYLANETGEVGESWHAHAERMEHELSTDEINRLAQRLGHPRYDPHGDPIPTRDGDSPAPKGFPLADCGPGFRGQIVRLSDHPDEVFGRLCKEGLAPGLAFEIALRRGGALILRVAGREIVCDEPMVAAITVEELTDGADFPADAIRLTDLRNGESGEILEVSPACRGPERRRLLDLGIVKGGRITAELAGIFRSPVGYRINNTLVALRPTQSDNIFIRRSGSGAGEVAV